MEYVVPSTGYVDAAVPENATSVTVKLLAEAEVTTGLGVDVQDYGSSLRVRVYNASNGNALAGAIVLAQAGNKYASATTDQDGYATIPLDADSATITVYYLKDGVVYKASTTWLAPPPLEITQQEQGAIDKLKATITGDSAAIAVAAVLLIAIIAVIIIARGRR